MACIRELLLLSLVLAGFLLRLFLGILAESNEGVNVLWLQIEKLVDLPGIRELVEFPLLSSVLAGFLPQLVLRLFFSLMPYILAFLERLEGLPAESEVEFGVVRKYFAFQVSQYCTG